VENSTNSVKTAPDQWFKFLGL